MSSFAVSIRIGTSLAARSRLHTSRPSSPGSIQSRIDQIGRVIAGDAQPGLPVARDADAVALVNQRAFDELRDARFVFDQ